MNGQRTVNVSVLTAIGSLGLTGCSEATVAQPVAQEEVYCTVEQDGQLVVVDEDYCEEKHYYPGYPYFYSVGHYGSDHRSGFVLPKGGKRVTINDTMARQKLGLPAHGTVRPGTRVNAGFGRGGGSSASASAAPSDSKKKKDRGFIGRLTQSDKSNSRPSGRGGGYGSRGGGGGR